ncbi:TRAP transporter substrate-binding protein [Vibrio diazotrophicus]|uniref:C4-dicarboxylate ABC transporter n=2 Tax=Vibrionaceae TaxID=641 RepID=A0A2J8GRW2_VIBDI|nr:MULTISPECIES: TRAP transporter substrate-binding protein [Vibrio]MCF7363762.1 TRAP transporter substrate-binding protein [Vibrio sp. A1-b2]MCZ4372537.1 TRAP transporter substrate-binding protein [Vibrio diazotrophicus]PNH88751.1 C4-dicarboxylate ABC transporter [Vibrio diazotrophicus]PNH95387.1 C4-dicarboxylate ABC transporter [Vibrio diazotrophicus]PNI02160.1 C4-dicarboxylate ABC transporter [Vibrio diazotrophicus]
MLKKSALKLAAIATVVGSALSYSSIASAATEIKAAFNQSDKHPQYLALKEFGEKLNKETDGRYKLNIFPNELLGDQRAALELVQNGAIQMAVVANPLVENYDKTFAVIGMPYVYTGSAHQEKVFTSGVLDNLFASTQKFGFEVLTAYTAGARSMYTKGNSVANVADMKGKKIRVMQSDTMIKMLSCMGGTGVPMSQGEVYTAVQQGVLDGAENNEITYADLKQYEVAPYFSATRHLMVPDLVVASSYFLSTMSKEDQATFKKLAKESTVSEFALWNAQIETAKKTAMDKGATFVEVDIKPFQESCSALQKDLIKTPEQKDLFEKVAALQ